jgi:hypothetical protein
VIEFLVVYQVDPHCAGMTLIRVDATVDDAKAMNQIGEFFEICDILDAAQAQTAGTDDSATPIVSLSDQTREAILNELITCLNQRRCRLSPKSAYRVLRNSTNEQSWPALRE